MPDETSPAVLRGFNVAVADIADRLRFCQPVLSFRGDSTLYVARKLDWRNDPKALAVTDPDDVNELGTPLPDARQSIASGEGVVAVGAGFVQAAADAGIQLDHAETSFLSLDDAKCRIGVATPERYEDLKERLTEEARTVFDEALGKAARHGRPLSERGNAALLLLRTCGPRRLDDLAIRQLAGALQNRELDLYRRLRIRFSDELGTPEDDLDRKAELHITLSAYPWRPASRVLPKQKTAALWELPSRYVPFPMSSISERNISIPDDKFSTVMEPGKSRDDDLRSHLDLARRNIAEARENFPDALSRIREIGHTASFDVSQRSLTILLHFTSGERSLASRQDLEDTLWIGAAVVRAVSEAMREMADTLGIEAQRGCIGANFEDNLKRAEDALEEIKRLHAAMRGGGPSDDGG